MKSCVFITKDENTTRELGKKLARLLRAGDVLALEGDLGAGKTTFSQGIAEGLGISEKVDSPTFTLIKEYMGSVMLYHMDVYRIETSRDELGLEEYFYGDGICIVEWASKVEEWLPENAIRCFFSLQEDGSREIVMRVPSSRSEVCKELKR